MFGKDREDVRMTSAVATKPGGALCDPSDCEEVPSYENVGPQRMCSRAPSTRS